MQTLSPLQTILARYRTDSKTEREKGNYFEELIRTYLRYEPTYADLYSDVWLLKDVPAEFGISKRDTGIDLVARTNGTGEFHAIQCKFHDADDRIRKSDIDSFFTASGQKPFSHRVIITTTNEWTENAEASLFDQQPPVSRIDLLDLETSQIDWARYQPDAEPALKPKYAPRPHQQGAINHVIQGLKSADRGKLIMACGTGKTFTALKIAEQQAGKGKRVLFLVPSLALISQTLTEWTQQSETPLHSFAVCSDSEIGKKRKADDDIVQTFVHELRYPATTHSKRLAEEMAKRHDPQHMSVVFSTYHSIEVISRAQKKYGLGEFDLIICDEAHRTTGATFESELESAFVRVHDNDFLKGRKRLYMTATPRIYADIAKAKAIQESVTLCSMDNEELYGKQLHLISFSEAVERNLLTDYKVVVLTIDEDHVSERLQNLLKDENNQLKVDDAARIVGCWKALAKQGLAEEFSDHAEPMHKAVAFCQVIEPALGRKLHKVSSKQISEMFQDVVDAYLASSNEQQSLRCEAAHVDGSMNATTKVEKLEWLKADTNEDVCRILCNVRCLSEGVDVPALDAVLFLSPRSSQVEVVQSVGRVMRNAPGKKLGYVILPVVIPHGMDAAEALNDNKVYKVVWEVLQALRSHDDRFDSFVNKLDLMSDPSGKMEVIAVSDSYSPKQKPKDKTQTGKGGTTIGTPVPPTTTQVQRKLEFTVDGLERALYAKLVKKCGTRGHWEDWANDIAKIARTHIGRITAIVSDEKNTKEATAFRSFANEIRDDLNDSITDEEVIEMLAQHLITKPVFDALFADYSFASHNPVSQGMQNILDLLHEHHLEKEADTLESFYASVRRRAEGIDKAEGKQKIVVELYDKFFRNAFPKMTERLGIVYTPVEVVDFIIHSVNDILQEEFGQTLGSEGVHILDPFVGTGTFITRLMQSGLITPEQLPHKYKHEIHCNEIVLLAYYIAAINIEAVYHSIVGGEYEPFGGILLTDTFGMYESEDQFEQLFPDNSERRKRQKKLDIRVIVGNPPYSAQQTSETDNNKNITYDVLDSRIRSTYSAQSSSKLAKPLYDSYIRGIRWASDRVGKSGVVGFVTNAGFLEAQTSDGLRKCLSDEFSTIYVFHLRGNQRTSGELSRKEGGKVFGSGSRAPIAITILVKNPNDKESKINWHDIGDYKSREEKLDTIRDLGSVRGITARRIWQRVIPDKHYDWVDQRDERFDEFVQLGSKDDGSAKTCFAVYSLGVVTNRDAWVYGTSRAAVESKVTRLIADYEAQRLAYAEVCRKASDQGGKAPKVEDFLKTDPTTSSWTRALKSDVRRNRKLTAEDTDYRIALYRPFDKRWMCFSRRLNEMVYKMAILFPTASVKNRVIGVSASESRGGFSVFMADHLPSLHATDMVGSQYFPLYVFDNVTALASRSGNSSLFPDSHDEQSIDQPRHAISDDCLELFTNAYLENGEITKEDLFYYIYGLLHSPEYRERYKDNLSKELPRIPAVKKFEDFQGFSQAGRDLAHWHLDYETVKCHPVTLDFTSGPKSLDACKDNHFYVRKMKFAKTRDPETGKSVSDKTTVIYNEYITVRDIPLEAYDYVVNGKPAIEWVMERQAVTTDKASGIVNDANLWATETMGNAAYPLELLMRIVTVSLETNRIVGGLPALEIG